MKRLFATLALALLAVAPALPTSAAGNFVQDGASLLSPDTVSQLNQQIGAFQAQTGKEVVVITVPSLNGSTAAAAAQAAFSSQNINGVLIYIAKAERQDFILPGKTEFAAGWFPSETISSISQSMVEQFKLEDYNGGITTGVNGVLNVYRSHVSSLPNSGATASNGNYSNNNAYASHSRGGHGSFMWIVFIVIGFFVIRSIFRNMSGRNYGGPMGGPGYGGQPMGGPGYGGGYGGGGGFWSGMLGGLGGAFIGNELFGNHGGGGGFMDQSGGMGGGQMGGGDNGAGWGNDAGQSGMGGGGDFGGGGFGDFGGGGGDMGGGGGW